MEELLEGVDMAELQKGVMSDPNIRETVQEVLKNPEALNEFKNFFTGGSKWRNKHTRNRKKRGSGGTHSKATHPMSKDDGTRKRSDATAHEIEDKTFRSLEKHDYLRKQAEDLKTEILQKEQKDLSTATKDNPTGKKVMYGGKWSLKYKRSINCRKPKGFSQKQYCKRKNRKSKKKRKKSRKKRKRRKKKRTRRKRR